MDAVVEKSDIEQRNELIAELFELKADIDLIEQGSLKQLKTRRAEIENILKATLEPGEKISFKGMGSVSVKEEIVPNVEDWPAVYEYIKENSAFYLLMRKVNAAPYRESLEIGMPIPGVAPTTIRKLSVRKS